MTEKPTLARYPYVHVDVPPDEAELVSLSLFELGASGVEQRDASTFTRPDAMSTCTLVGSFSDVAAAQAAVEQLGPGYAARVAFVAGDDWKDRWKSHFKPLRVGPNVVIRPSWEAFEPAESDVIVTLDPGGAFGTGTHESTRLVLSLLQQTPLEGKRFLDVGCGSGILAVAALLLGAAEALAIDVDPASIDATLENAEVNGVRDKIEASTLAIAKVEGAYPLVLSNIEAHILIPMAGALSARVAPGGVLILSGILTHQGDDVVAAYDGLTCTRREVDGEWVALQFEKPARG